MTPKIATCCYCGTRAALTLGGTERHELACSNCGAPLHEMKMFRASEGKTRKEAKPHQTREFASRSDFKKKKKQKKTKSLSRRFMEDVFDAAEDLFDLFD